jgi:HEAT repeat protein
MDEAMNMMRFAVALAVAFLVAQVSFGEEWPDLAHYKYGEGKAAEDAEKLLQKTPVAQHGGIEDSLIAVVTAKDATQDGKALACRLLQRIGTEKCIPAVAELLGDEVLSHYARLVLQRMGIPKADEAMRTALAKAPDKLKVGILGSLGERRDAQAVPQIAPLAAHADPAVASAAIRALGKIGGSPAAECLSKLKPAESIAPVHMTALVDCARSLKGADAVALYQLVLAGKTPQRVGALSGMLAADEKKAVALMVDFIKGNDVRMSSGVLTLVVGEKSEYLTTAMAELLGSLPDEKKVALITVLGARGDKAALASIAGCLTGTDERVRSAAVMALTKVGDGGIVPTLLGMSGGSTEAIAKMTDSSVNDALIKALDDNKLKAPAIKALAARTCVAALPKLFDLLNDGDAAVRSAAWTGLGALATEEDIARVAKAAFAIKDPAEMSCGVIAARDICARAGDKAKCFDVVAGYYDGTTDAAKAIVIELASVVGSPSALDLVRKAMKSGNKELYGKAVRSLAGWCNESAAADLLELAKSAPEEVERILALRGYIRIAGLDNVNLSADKRAEMFKTAAEMATRADEKKLIIGGLQKAKNAATLAIVNKYMDDPALRNEAEQYAIIIVEQLQKKGPAAEVKELATKLLTSKNRQIADKAKSVLASMGSK